MLVERRIQPRLRFYGGQKFCFLPSKTQCGADVPRPFLVTAASLQNRHILRPAEVHRQAHDFGGFLIGRVKCPHTAHIAGRKAVGCGIGRLQVFRCRDSRAFLRSAADHSANLAVQFHLRELCRHKRVQCGEHGDVICGFANVHGLSPFRRGAPDQRSKQRKARRCHRVFLCFDLLQMIRTICSQSRMCFSSMALLS